mmetsp:Transcript_5227/g.14821  ORF Transcript_5227/g.14821 Transcript_5227/m.14821 type:complete len:95 (+) Transcript_5227:2778-3062(+)
MWSSGSRCQGADDSERREGGEMPFVDLGTLFHEAPSAGQGADSTGNRSIGFPIEMARRTRCRLILYYVASICVDATRECDQWSILPTDKPQSTQ